MKIPPTKNLYTLLLSVFMLQLTIHADTLKILMIGNSYSNRSSGAFEKILQGSGIDYTLGTRIIGGCNLDRHAHGLYDATKDTLDAEKWDYVIFQGQSNTPAYNVYLHGGTNNSSYANDLDVTSANDLVQMAKNSNPDTKIIWYSTQAYYPNGSSTYGRKMSDMNNYTSQAYNYYNDHFSPGGRVAEVGDAFLSSYSAYPNIALHETDGSHPDTYGRYLTGCVLFSTITGRSVTGLNDGFNIDASIKSNLQQIADATTGSSATNWGSNNWSYNRMTDSLDSVSVGAPIGSEDSFSVIQGAVLTVNVTNGLLSNDTDAQGDPIVVASYMEAIHGTLVVNANGSLTYTPNAGFSGMDSFSYVPGDNSQEGNSVSVSIEVTPSDKYMVSHWKLNETSGTSAKDSSGNGNDGTFSGNPVWAVDGKYDGALSFDGAGDSVTQAYGNTLSEYTLSLWVKASTLTQSAGAGLFNNDSNGGSGTGFQLRAINGNYQYKGSLALNLGKVTLDWDHLAIVFDGTRTTTYYNGAKVGSNVSAGNVFKQIQIGSNPAGNLYFNGLIDDVRIYYKSLVSSEIMDLSTLVPVANAAPVANNDSYAVDQDSTLSVTTAEGLFINDTDGDGDPLQITSFTNTNNGALTVYNDGSFDYTPNSGFVGEDTFTYIANDGTEDSASASVTITVNAVETPPTPPTSSGGWAVLLSEDFESGFGIFTPGSQYAMIDVNPANAYDGSQTLNLEGYWDGSSLTAALTNAIDATGYNEIQVDFDYICRSIDSEKEDFKLEYWDGSDWVSAHTFVLGTDFVNGVFNSVSVMINGPFTSDFSLRFRFGGNGKIDDVYIDNVVISGNGAEPVLSVLLTEDFESGFGIFTPGSQYAMIDVNPANAYDGSQTLNLEGYWDGSSLTAALINAIDATGYNEIQVDFDYICRSIDSEKEDFNLEYWDGSDWISAHTFVLGMDFVNGVFNSVSAMINGPFTSDFSLRFRFGGNGKIDDVYIDNVVISGK